MAYCILNLISISFTKQPNVSRTKFLSLLLKSDLESSFILQTCVRCHIRRTWDEFNSGLQSCRVCWQIGVTSVWHNRNVERNKVLGEGILVQTPDKPAWTKFCNIPSFATANCRPLVCNSGWIFCSILKLSYGTQLRNKSSDFQFKRIGDSWLQKQLSPSLALIVSFPKLSNPSPHHHKPAVMVGTFHYLQISCFGSRFCFSIQVRGCQ